MTPTWPSCRPSSTAPTPAHRGGSSVGLPGVGKTSLAVELGARSTRAGPGRPASCSTCAGSTPHRVPLTTTEAVAQILASVGVPSRPGPGRRGGGGRLYRQSCVTGRCCWCSTTPAARPRSARCCPLATDASPSSQPRPPGGAHRPGGQCGATAGPADRRRRGPTRGGRLGLVLDLDADSATRLVQRCGRLPLALRIAAARLAVNTGLNVDTLARQLERDHGGLATLGLDDSEADVARSRSRTGSCRPTPPGCCVCSARSPAMTFGRGCHGRAAAPPARGRAQPGRAASASLIDLTAPGRYTLHDLVRQFAMRLGGDVDEDALRDGAARRLVDYYLDGVDVADRVIRPMRQRPAPTLRFPPQKHLAFADQAQALAWLDAEYRNLVACVHGCPRARLARRRLADRRRAL